MDPEFQRALTIVLAAGSFIGLIGTVALYFIFRSFGRKEAGGSVHMGSIVALVTFIFICCAALFLLSYSER